MKLTKTEIENQVENYSDFVLNLQNFYECNTEIETFEVYLNKRLDANNPKGFLIFFKQCKSIQGIDVHETFTIDESFLEIVIKVRKMLNRLNDL